MSNFAILRHEKITSRAKLSQVFAHNKRKIDVPNTDDSIKNIYIGASDPLAKFDLLLTKHNIKPRENAVLAFELLMTFSPEQKSNINPKQFARLALDWLKKEFPEQAILSFDLHLDETTPHIQAVVMPLIHKTVRGKEQWRLAAKDYTGTPELLRQRQTRFAEAMEPLGLQRGRKFSKAKHRAIKLMYGQINEELETAEKMVSELIAKIPAEPKITDFFNIKSIIKSLGLAVKNIGVLARKSVLADIYKAETNELKNRIEDLEVTNRALRSDARAIRSVLGVDNANEAYKAIQLLKDKEDEAIRAKYASHMAVAPNSGNEPEPVFSLPASAKHKNRNQADDLSL
jgi:Plasmid recombination enzyme.